VSALDCLVKEDSVGVVDVYDSAPNLRLVDFEVQHTLSLPVF
jgi:hypothetical protein